MASKIFRVTLAQVIFALVKSSSEAARVVGVAPVHSAVGFEERPVYLQLK